MVPHFVTKERVLKVIRAAQLDNEITLVNFVTNHAARLFLILVLMSRSKAEYVSLLKTLKDNNFSDKALPIKFEKDGNGESLVWYWYSAPSSATSTHQASFVVPDWERTDKDSFESYQWRFISPTFGKPHPFRSQFHYEIVLPYFDVATKAVSEGFFGEVSKVQVHQAHINVRELDGKAQGDWVAVALKKANDNPELAEFFDKEANNLERLRSYKSKHLIKPIAAYEHRGDRCLIFPWADGGNLSEYWVSFTGNPLAGDHLRWIVHQVCGLFSAIEELHNSNCRHGDLKPENILVYVDKDKNQTLQIADLGLAAFHDKVTNIRRAANLPTQTPAGTSRYEPPEMDRERNQDQYKYGGKDLPPRSRAYDLWSMGCVVLELLIWLSYGFTAVDDFQKRTSYFWEPNNDNSNGYQVHSHVNDYIEKLSNRWQTGSACKDLLVLVQKRLLIVEVSDDNKSFPRHRTIASEAYRRMKEVQRKYYPVGTTDSGLAPGHGSDHQGIKSSLPPHEDNLEEFNGLVGIERKATEKKSDFQRTLVPGTQYRVNIKYEQRSKLNDTWESLSDNTFALQVFEQISWHQVRPLSGLRDSILCAKCSAITSITLFESECHVSEMQESCDLCGLLFHALKRAGIMPPAVVKLRQTGTTIGLEGGPNLLSIYIEPGHDIPPGRQIGLPRLPEPSSQEQLTLFKQWISKCDSTHGRCLRRHAGQDTSEMPTRLVKVTEPMQLLDSSRIEPCQYIALSHCWGQLQKHERFCLSRSNYSQLRERIDFDRLPKTFKDAIVVTRGLGIDYIWIDTLCIIQDDKKDWENESTKMEEVFSAAYCTISAASAKSSLDGFLSDRQPRPCVQLRMKNSRDLYVCSYIDDFHQDVELAEINRRGWVLQERALSRRSIYYTPNQVYWECGEGIRCETLGRLYNSKATFLGDANFPQSALEYYRDGRQLLIQDLYERYSALAFTMASDRAVAILGLQKRLARAFKTQAAHGSFATYFARSILWSRNQPTEMTTITQPTGRHVPSWSWFSKEGKIEYMHLEFEKIEWMKSDFKSPFARPSETLSDPTSTSGYGGDTSVFQGFARRMDISEEELTSQAIFDKNNELKAKDFRVVVIGRDKDEGMVDDGPNSPKLHVLVIRKSSSSPRENLYERVGVASLSPKQVLTQGFWVDVW
ncbi:Interleukin-1 receptor-associated kinase 4 [Colletotrichum chlorophyti]|uniref:Interleukin-1 receptor-associated kinase 4 n=1 Tax=Colletotrichum chlorophyti TaxID=708187 RepID=A0A1Q8RCB6_9PEZI|nr:Interleukin-1 receptor-associated kinase 4 [Colletotrichum chlorophyti]